ncbi:hypothetical protein FHS83_003721 [Rhizomicrobium palustre]|uniref:CHRD domain-containing protein n=1 Tax=Rhizomicrobium palustre TaxID=189966 RepID=A0A846N453_9PROT|nr:CHRD domain-containing protein [Rhizomicrobium palustre]NIK90403.1 hypothetical protein [Rhizomicrobium palustre]
MRLLIAIALIFGLGAAPAQATQLTFGLFLNGANEATPNASAGFGNGWAFYDSDLHSLDLLISFADLTGDTVAAHIHCCTTTSWTGTAMVATELPSFSNLPLGVTDGTFSQSYDLTNPASFNQAFITASGGLAAAETALVMGMESGQAYLNIHTTAYPGGEIRDFFHELIVDPVPEPASFAVLGTGLLLAGWSMRRKRRVNA